MARNELKRRVAALEHGNVNQWFGPCAWLVLDEGETVGAARARYEASHGALGERPLLTWQAATDAEPCEA